MRSYTITGSCATSAHRSGRDEAELTGTATAVAFYIAGVMVIAFIATLLLRDRTAIPLGPDAEAQQASRHFIWQK